MKTAPGVLPVIAEGLGVITPEVEPLRDTFGFPGMRILQMVLGNDPKATHDQYPRTMGKNVDFTIQTGNEYS